jgi:glycosyltransferase involved in cell wall biosynthesis
VKFSNISPSKVTVTYEAADLQKSQERPAKLPFKKYLLYVGKHSSYKNVRRLAEAHQKLLIKYPDLGLVLANTKDQAVLNNEKLFQQKNYQNIHFFGRADNHDLAWLYPHTEAYIFPSLMEGFGLPGLEAMGLGAPVISSNATCLPEVYGRAALYFDPFNTDNMVTQIDKVLSDHSLRKKLIQLGHAQHKKYSWERLARETLAVYQRSLNSN